MYQVNIDKAILSTLPPVEYDGDIYVIDTIGQVNAAVAHLRKQAVVGFDTETRPSFQRGGMRQVALLQLATPHEAFLFRLNRLGGIPRKVKDYLEDENHLKAGLSIHDDFAQLNRLEPVKSGGFVELQQVAREHLIADLSLQKIYAILFGKRISKGQRLTNWEAETLSPAQQRYAAIDAWACIHIYNRLTGGEFSPKTSPYYHEVPLAHEAH
ncbi:MAG: 3'-5' exonuclease domain-containing protein 2 [Muribaculaceae bacterium]|nr:3'-5' exonuclease domain-containing protein 2 [Muribaculaceae bacterium]